MPELDSGSGDKVLADAVQSPSLPASSTPALHKQNSDVSSSKTDVPLEYEEVLGPSGQQQDSGQNESISREHFQASGQSASSSSLVSPPAGAQTTRSPDFKRVDTILSVTTTPTEEDRCQCGMKADSYFAVRLFQKLGVEDMSTRCRDCKAVRLLQERVEVDKYCYGGWLFSRKKKYLKLSKNREELCFWPIHRSQVWQVVVPVRDILGVVFGAYTCTFKRQTSMNLPPHWAAFSLVGKHRTYDFSARDPEVVESCVRTLQQAIWDRRLAAFSALPGTLDQKTTVCPDLGAFEPWPLGFFLWMRLRFRLQDEANKRNLGPDHMLWIVFMKCAFLTSDEVSKARFIDMAEKLQQDKDFQPALTQGGNEIRELSARIRFQKEREMDIVKDRYECRVETFLPRAPNAVVGSSSPGTGREVPAGKKNEGVDTRSDPKLVKRIDPGLGKLAAPDGGTPSSSQS